jgi:Cyclic nucleotide-binding domain/Major Facilitator Superfamily
MAGPRQLPPVSTALRNPELRRVLVAYLASIISEWALWVALLVYAYERSGKTVVGLVSISLFVPGALVAPFAGAAADGPRPNRVLANVYATQAVTLAIAASLAYLRWPLLTVIVPAAVSLTMLSYIRPCFSVVVPGLVKSAGELTAANLLTGYCDSGSVLAGPLIASALIALDGPPIVLAVTASLAALGLLVTLPLVGLDPSAASQPAPEREGSRTGALVDGVRALSQRKGALQLLTVLGGQYVLIGALDLLYVVLATEKFGLGLSGPGILGAAFGAGALLGGAASTVLVARKRLAPLLMLSMLGICGSLAIIAGFTTYAVALVVLPVVGLSRAVLDLTGRMLMQRAAPQDALASIFATMESLSLIAAALGSLVGQVVIAVAGVRAAVAAVAVVLGTLLVLTAKRLVQIDASADAPVVAIRLLRRIALFAPLPGPALEGVARAARPVRFATGDTIIREGDPGDSYYAIVDGEVDVTMEGRHIRVMDRGQGFGEIALLADVPRTATIVARTDVELLEIERPAFLTAVTGHDASKQAAWGVARTLHPVLETADAVADPEK